MSSLAHKVGRTRPPRVQITYDVEIGNAMKKVELPFVVGVLADLTGQPKAALKPLLERKMAYIDRDNFNTVLQQAAPHLSLRVADRISGGDAKLAVDLNFKEIDDFEPARVAEQIGPTRELLEMRHKLNQLLSQMSVHLELEPLLAEVLNSTEKAKAEAQKLGIEAAASPSDSTPAEAPK
jgi:type VI secretion system protein ImpB